MDPQAFETWCLVDHGKAAATVKYHMSRLRALRRDGFDADAFLATPAGGEVQGDAVIARMKVEGRTAHVLRNQQRLLNWLSAYAEHLTPGKTWKRWPLQAEPPSAPRTVDGDLQRLWTYQGPDDYTTKLRRAIAYVGYHGNFRRSEVASLELDDLLPESGQIELDRAAKGGISGPVEVPWTLFYPGNPLYDYL